jgi:hypothetical protein
MALHVLDHEQPRQAGVADFALDQGARDDAGGFAAEAQDLVRDHAHQADLAAAVDEGDVVFDQYACQHAGGVGIQGLGAIRGAAVDGD